jgi:hypothetical protein
MPENPPPDKPWLGNNFPVALSRLQPRILVVCVGPFTVSFCVFPEHLQGLGKLKSRA